jgi:hypothetical protein
MEVMKCSFVWVSASVVLALGIGCSSTNAETPGPDASAIDGAGRDGGATEEAADASASGTGDAASEAGAACSPTAAIAACGPGAVWSLPPPDAFDQSYGGNPTFYVDASGIVVVAGSQALKSAPPCGPFIPLFEASDAGNDSRVSTGLGAVDETDVFFSTEVDTGSPPSETTVRAQYRVSRGGGPPTTALYPPFYTLPFHDATYWYGLGFDDGTPSEHPLQRVNRANPAAGAMDLASTLDMLPLLQYDGAALYWLTTTGSSITVRSLPTSTTTDTSQPLGTYPFSTVYDFGVSGATVVFAGVTYDVADGGTVSGLYAETSGGALTRLDDVDAGVGQIAVANRIVVYASSGGVKRADLVTGAITTLQSTSDGGAIARGVFAGGGHAYYATDRCIYQGD